jgi:PAS domain-containing protein
MLSSSKLHPDAAPPALRTWRDQALNLMLRIGVVVFLLAMFLDVVGSWQRGRFDWVAAVLTTYLILSWLAFWPQLAYRVRIYGLISLATSFGLLTILNLGLVGAGRLYIFFAAILSVIMLERREAIVTWILVSFLGAAALGALALGAIPISSAVAQRAVDPNTLLVNTVAMLSLMITLGSVTLSLISRLTLSLREAEGALAERDAVNMQLETLVEARTDELRRSQAVLQGLLDNSPVAIYVKDCDGRYLLTNRYLYESYGLSASQMQGQRDSALFGASTEPWRAHEQEVIASGQPVVKEVVKPHGDDPRFY